MHAIQLENPFDTTHPIIICLKLNGVTSYYYMRKQIQEEYDDQNILKVELMVKVPSWDPSNPEFIGQEQTMFDYRGQFVVPNTSARG